MTTINEAAERELELARLEAAHYKRPESDIPALAAFERYRIEQVKILGMPGLSAVPCFIAGFHAGQAARASLPPIQVAFIAGKVLHEASGATSPAPSAVAPWEDRMIAHYNQGKSVRMRPESYFMQQEIADWRASAATIKNSLTVAGASTDHAPKFDEAEFAAMVEKGTAAWKDVPANWLEKLRGAGSAADARDAARMEALHSAVSAIYFDSSVDHARACWAVVKALAPELVEQLADDPGQVYDRSLAAIQAKEA